jgi:hypothetical protein
LFVTDARVVRTRSGNAYLIGANRFVEVLVAGPAAVEEGVEGERKVGGGKYDEVQVAEKERGFGYC